MWTQYLPTEIQKARAWTPSAQVQNRQEQTCHIQHSYTLLTAVTEVTSIRIFHIILFKTAALDFLCSFWLSYLYHYISIIIFLPHQHKAAGMNIRLSKNNDHNGVSHGVECSQEGDHILPLKSDR